MPHIVTRCFLTKKIKTIAGTAIIKPAVNLRVSGEAIAVLRICAGSVRLVKVNIVATNTSFHDKIKANIAEAAKPGNARGRVIRKNACIRERPKIIAASS